MIPRSALSAAEALHLSGEPVLQAFWQNNQPYKAGQIMFYLPNKSTVVSALTIGLFTFSFQQARADDKAAAQSKLSDTELRTRQLSQNRIQREQAEAERQARAQPIEEALAAVNQTQEAIKLIDQKDTAKATSSLESAIGKLDLLLSQHPNMALTPVSVNVSVQDFVATDPTIKAIGKQAKELVNKSDYQAARHLLAPFASEINVTTVNLPTATYPNAIRAASQLLSKGQNDQARAQLQAALSSLVIAERSIPLPLIRAQALIDETNRLAGEKKLDKAQGNQLLDEASSQLKVAEDMGYVHKKDIAQLEDSIKKTRKDIEQHKSMLSKIDSDLQSLKQKIFAR